jgi:hypothetical protein
MSHHATNWAIQRRGLKPTTKIVLWHLCDRFNPDYGCFPSQERLAHDCEISRSTLNLHLIRLETGGLLRRVVRIDPVTKRQMSTRYFLGFEEGFAPETGERRKKNPATDNQNGEKPCPEFGHGPETESSHKNNNFGSSDDQTPCPDSGHGAVSDFSPEPCPKNSQSRVRNSDTNLVREPLSKPVKEEEDAQAREGLSDLFFAKLLQALGFDPGGSLPAWWQGPSAKTHARRWHEYLGLTKIQILKVAEESRHEHPAPPDGPKALDRFMERAARRDAQSASMGDRFGKSKRQRKQVGKTRPCIDELAAFYAKLINSDQYLHAGTISNTMRDAMLSRELVTQERLQMRGVL